MGLTVTFDDVMPCPFFKTGAIDFDDSYPTGGEPIDLSRYFSTVIGMIIEPKYGCLFEYDNENKKVLAKYFNYDAETDGVAIEFPNETDLSSVTGVRFIAYGRP